MAIFHLFSVYILMISRYYLIGQLCSSSWVVWDCLIFISCVFKASFTLSLLDFVLTIMKYTGPVVFFVFLFFLQHTTQEANQEGTYTWISLYHAMVVT